jgi:hypothetical protein
MPTQLEEELLKRNEPKQKKEYNVVERFQQVAKRAKPAPKPVEPPDTTAYPTRPGAGMKKTGNTNLGIRGSVYEHSPSTPSNEDAASKKLRKAYQYDEPLEGWGDTPYHLRFKERKSK